MFDPNDLENYSIYCDRTLEQISSEELLRKARHTKLGIRTRLLTFAGDVMIRIGMRLKAQAVPKAPTSTPSIYLRT